MVQIISDTCTLYSKKEGEKIGLPITPLSVFINEECYKEFETITTEELIDKINKGGIPTSSQPIIGEKIELYDKYAKDDEVIDITIAAGLSGTYDTALMAKGSSEHGDKVSVFNSMTLCGPQRALVDEALKMAKEGKSKDEILTMLEKSAKSDVSFLIPMDFEFLKRGGRVSKTVGSIGSLLKLIICLKKSDDGRCLEKHSINRTIKGAVESMIKELKNKGVDDSYIFSISHALNEELAAKFKEALLKAFPNAKVNIFTLSPVFTTQGGPKCCALQAIKIIR